MAQTIFIVEYGDAIQIVSCHKAQWKPISLEFFFFWCDILFYSMVDGAMNQVLHGLPGTQCYLEDTLSTSSDAELIWQILKQY